MNARFYIGLVSISFGATALGMTRMEYHDYLPGMKRSGSRDIAPVYAPRNFGSPTPPHSHSAPEKSYVPGSPKTPKRPFSAQNQSPQNKALVKKGSYHEDDKRSASEGAVPDMSKQVITPCPTCSTPLVVIVAASTLSQVSVQKS